MGKKKGKKQGSAQAAQVAAASGDSAQMQSTQGPSGRHQQSTQPPAEQGPSGSWRERTQARGPGGDSGPGGQEQRHHDVRSPVDTPGAWKSEGGRGRGAPGGRRRSSCQGDRDPGDAAPGDYQDQGGRGRGAPGGRGRGSYQGDRDPGDVATGEYQGQWGRGGASRGGGRGRRQDGAHDRDREYGGQQWQGRNDRRGRGGGQPGQGWGGGGGREGQQTWKQQQQIYSSRQQAYPSQQQVSPPQQQASPPQQQASPPQQPQAWSQQQTISRSQQAPQPPKQAWGQQRDQPQQMHEMQSPREIQQALQPKQVQTPVQQDAEQAASAGARPKQPQIQRGEERQQDAGEVSPSEVPSDFATITTGMSNLCVRQGGRRGRPIPLATNHFEMKLGKVKTVHHYDVQVDQEKSKKFFRELFKVIQKQCFSDYHPAFDGRKNIFSARPLPFGDEMEGTFVIKDTDRKDITFKVKLTKVGKIDLGLIDKFFNQMKTGIVTMEPMTALQALDVVLRHSMGFANIVVGSSFFSKPDGPILDLGEGMQMYRGNYQSVGLGWKPFLNVDVSNKAFPKAMPVIELIRELFRTDCTRPLSPRDIETLNKSVKNLRVTYELKGNTASRRTYRVNEVDEPPGRIWFKRDKGEEITILDYYKKDKGIVIGFPEMPCLFVGSKESKIKVRVPIEFCTILPGQVVNRKLTPNQTRNMIRNCATNTDVRKNSILHSVRMANYNRDPVVNEFDMQVSQNFQELKGRVLDSPKLSYKDSQIKVSRGVWKANPFISSKPINCWTILNLDNRTQDQDLRKLGDWLIKEGRTLHVQMGPPIPPQTKRLPQGRELEELKDYFRMMKQKGAELIVVVFSDYPDFMYNFIKQAAELNVGCLTQCVKSRTVQRLTQATVSNIILKINAKLEGVNHFLTNRPPIMDRPTIIMGADVTHPSPDSKDIPSIAAVTASHDPKAFMYNLCWRLQDPRTEIIVDLKTIVREQLMFFYKQNKGTKPERIIFYRDGVSNGEFEKVRNMELTAIREACSALGGTDYKPSITFLVVQKRHHTRLFPLNPKDSEDKNNNVPAGTCVDTIITHPTIQNFYLVSHASIQGVAKPTKYVTLWDDNNFSDDDIEELTYYLCHMFARCTRSVSYPAPTYYAHLAAARAKVYCENKKLNLEKLADEQGRMQIQDCIYRGKPMFFI